MGVVFVVITAFCEVNRHVFISQYLLSVFHRVNNCLSFIMNVLI